MSITDLPKIDLSSANDDEAKSFLTGLFSQKSGFITREQNPDKGCDYFAELIEDSSATNWNLGIQLKSIEQPDFIENATLISYTWKTSRLNYLKQTAPIYGLLVLYDVSTAQAYYEYIDKIYLKLMDRVNEDWKVQENVNVHVPVDNILNATSLTAIYETFLDRFKNHALMSREQARNYGLPSLKKEDEYNYEFNKVEDIIKVLLGWRGATILPNDISFIFGLICKVPNADILAHKELLILAAFTYNGVGKLAESSYYTERLIKRFELGKGDKQMIDYIKLKNDLGLGAISAGDFLATIKSSLQDTINPENQITLRLNIVYFELNMIKGFQNIPFRVVDEIHKLAETIELMEETANKYYLKLWNLDNLSTLISHVRKQKFNEINVRETFLNPMPMDERANKANQIAQMIGLFRSEMHSINQYAISHQNFLLHAYAIYTITRFNFSLHISAIAFNGDSGHSEETRNDLDRQIELAEHGYRVFQENKLLNEAYNLLCLVYELLILCTEWYQFESQITPADTLSNLTALEAELELKPYNSKAFQIIDHKRNKNNDPTGGMKYFVQLDEEQMANMADSALRTGKFPDAKKENMIHEMRGIKIFYQRCTNPDIIPEVAPPDHMRAYAVPVCFQLKNLKTGVVSTPSSDIEELLAAWGY